MGNSQGKRIVFIDISKGICMLLVVWQHCHTYYPNLQTGEYYLESFRMPLFFCISGMFFKPYSCYQEFIRRKFNSLLVPFIFFYFFFSFFIPNILYLIGYDGLRQSSNLGVMSIFNFIFEKKYSNNPVWFLLALFWLSSFFYFFYTLAKNICPKFHLVLLFVFSAVCGLIGFFSGVNDIFVYANIDNAMTACPYFYIGYLIKNGTNILNKRYVDCVLFFTTLLGLLYIYFFSSGIGYLQNDFKLEDLFPIYSCGIVGSLSILAFSKMIKKSRVLEFYGENTLVILCMQMPIIQVINIIIKRLNISGYFSFLLLFIIVLIALIPVTIVLNKYLPWFTGKKALLK